MRFFRRFFGVRRRSSGKDDHFIVEDSNNNDNKEGKKQTSRLLRPKRQSRGPSPEQRDDSVDHVDRHVDPDAGDLEGSIPAPPESTPRSSVVGHHAVDTQLSRISEVPSALSSSTATKSGSHHPAMLRVAPPPAREAAFHGPPRFDWMDIETNAAIKIQSIYRRNKVMSVLEKKGYSTSAIRNRKRRRKASRGKAIASADVPSIFSCCAVGLAFGDATEDDDAAYREFQKKQYEERVKQQQMHEDAIRKQYLRTQGAGIKVVEQIEVVE